MKKTLIVTVIVAAIAAVGYSYYRYQQAPVAPTVNTARVTRGDVAETVGATGQLQAVTTVQVGTSNHQAAMAAWSELLVLAATSI